MTASTDTGASMHKHYMTVGRRYEMTIGYSEAACHLRIAGKLMGVEITSGPYPMAQVYTPQGERYSFPITLGEAGIYTEGERVYYSHDAREVCPV